jgi:transcriptional regulator with XRE-family HTH domain
MQHSPWKWGGGTALGRILAAARERLGLSQSELARRLGVSGANLSRIEHGTDLRVSTLLEIARALQLEPMLVPKESVPSVRALLDDLQRPHDATPDRGRFT